MYFSYCASLDKFIGSVPTKCIGISQYLRQGYVHIMYVCCRSSQTGQGAQQDSIRGVYTARQSEVQAQDIAVLR